MWPWDRRIKHHIIIIIIIITTAFFFSFIVFLQKKLLATLESILEKFIIESIVCAFELSALQLDHFFMFIVSEFCDYWLWSVVLLWFNIVQAVEGDDLLFQLVILVVLW